MTSSQSPAIPTGDVIAGYFVATDLDESTCRRKLLAIMRPDPVCPGCQRAFTEEERQRLFDGKDIRCGCGRKSSPRSGTIIEGVRADYRSIMLLAVMHHWGRPKQEIAACCGMSEDTVRRIITRLTKA